jgi:hypothetical protein
LPRVAPRACETVACDCRTACGIARSRWPSPGPREGAAARPNPCGTEGCRGCAGQTRYQAVLRKV